MSPSHKSFHRPALACVALLMATMPSGPSQAQSNDPASTPYGTLDRTDFDPPATDAASKPAVLGVPAPVPPPAIAPSNPQADAKPVQAASTPVPDEAGMEAVAHAPVIAGAANPPAPWVPAATAAPREDDPTVSRLRDRARAALSTGSVAAARAILSDPALARDGESLDMLGDTYDPGYLARSGVVGVAGDEAAARRYRAAASDAGWRRGDVPR